jgi:hypothetical protein
MGHLHPCPSAKLRTLGRAKALAIGKSFHQSFHNLCHLACSCEERLVRNNRFMTTSDTLLHELRTWGRLSGSQLQQKLDISRATLMRAMRALGPQVVSLGRARRSAYAARRSLRGNANPLMLYRIDETGTPHESARLHPLHVRGCAVEFLEPMPWPLDGLMRDGWFEGIPYFLDDLRPQGFLGRHFAKKHAELLGVSADPQRWSEDDVYYALSVLGSDLPGNYVLGEVAMRAQLAQSAPQSVPDETCEAQYLQMALVAMAQGQAGSSAAGEFPKFTARRQIGQRQSPVHVIVKFSGSDGSPAVQRWSDLLVCEHLALSTINKALGLKTHVQAANSTVYKAGGRTFLEVQRFDRVGESGRLPVCSWAALNAALVGKETWLDGAGELVRKRLLAPDGFAQVQRLWLFGKLIANTDMHDGNLSFIPGTGGLTVAPAYDMLPMAYAPGRGVELQEIEFAPVRALPAERSAWVDAAHAARLFWEEAAQDQRISAEFRRICATNARTLTALSPT